MNIGLCAAFCFLLQFAWVSHVRADDLGSPGTTSLDVELAARPLGGPWAETGVGIGLTVATPVVWGVLAFALGPPLLECASLFEDYPDPDEAECDRRHAEQERQALLGATLAALPLGLLGVGLITHGAFRVARIRRARARLLARLPDLAPQVQLAPGQFGVGLRLSFR